MSVCVFVSLFMLMSECLSGGGGGGSGGRGGDGGGGGGGDC